MSRTLIAIGIVLTLGSGCSDPTTAPDDFQLPEPDLSLDPSRLSVGDYIATPCAFGLYGDRLIHLRDRHEWALVDVYFGRGASGPPDGPTASDIDLVAKHGGRVLFSFNVPAVRARIILSRIPDLVKNGFWVTVRDVPDPTRYDVPLSVGLTRALEDSDVEQFATLGGRVEYRFNSIRSLSGVLPNQSIPTLRSRSDVRYVEVNSIGCLG